MLGGIALTNLGAAWCFTFNGVSFIAVIISLLLLPVRPIAAKTGASVLTSIKEGLRFIDQHAGMSPLIAIAFLMTMLGYTDHGFPAGSRPGRLPYGPEESSH